MKEPTRTKVSVILPRPYPRKWGKDGGKSLWNYQNMGLPWAQHSAAIICSCHTLCIMKKEAIGVGAGLPPSSKPACSHFTNILRWQSMSSSAPAQRHKCLFKFQKHTYVLIHLYT